MGRRRLVEDGGQDDGGEHGGRDEAQCVAGGGGQAAVVDEDEDGEACRVGAGADDRGEQPEVHTGVLSLVAGGGAMAAAAKPAVMPASMAVRRPVP